jgi:hypothetical protein
MKFLEKIGSFLSNLFFTKQPKIELEEQFIEEKEVIELDKFGSIEEDEIKPEVIEEPVVQEPVQEKVETVGQIKSKSKRRPEPKKEEESVEKKPSKPKSRRYRPRKKKEGE